MRLAKPFSGVKDLSIFPIPLWGIRAVAQGSLEEAFPPDMRRSRGADLGPGRFRTAQASRCAHD